MLFYSFFLKKQNEKKTHGVIIKSRVSNRDLKKLCCAIKTFELINYAIRSTDLLHMSRNYTPFWYTCIYANFMLIHWKVLGLLTIWENIISIIV